MGLAPYGEPIYIDKIKDNLIKIADDGSFQINIDYFDFATGLKMTNEEFDRLFECKRKHQKQILKKNIWTWLHQFKKLLKKLCLNY